MNFEDAHALYLSNIDNHTLLRQEYDTVLPRLDNVELTELEREALNLELDNLRRSPYFNEPSFDVCLHTIVD
jgi:hypothetical protein